MKKNNLTKQFYVSCQALVDEPMFGKNVMLKMATAAIQGGAHGIRTSGLNNINSIKEKFPDIKLIGLLKVNYPNSDVYITPTLRELKLLINSKADLIALDFTSRKRPKQALKELVEYFNKNKRKDQFLLADIASIEDIDLAIKYGIKYIATTLRGYTKDTEGKSNTENDYFFLKEVIQKCKPNNCIVIAEGGFNTPTDAKNALDLGSDIVIVGSAITRPQYITKTFYDSMFSK
ncbi:N-acylglucosamine-6-phosphate 2-epimerase [Mycoplasma testudineum]|uniref:Putative N-acetylmannosamine-6-phosphate 2-epimerase n=1 Tax=Mycoplasma testudineum TaxID=244584 RepID=A0A4R6IF19_9MOLU|nr:N-acetylmannosamine-6-phosphate 2-epimerase [Mycoplasma testudineum]OYD26832.1 acetylmannosamine-6-phosphate 2-epimerase [Mycoplasma testudineum]TDO20366.1 N-acylglucosamine-6-phosphate 2-epimerase [Mycoplasma testudineum]